MNICKNIILGSLATIVSLSATAQNMDSAAVKRESLYQKYRTNKPFLVSFYNGRNSDVDMNTTINKYLPMANYLSEKFDRLVLFDVDSNIKSLSDNIIEGSDIIYTSPIMYDKLTKLGWTPLVVRNFDLSPSYIVKKGNEAVNLSGLKDKKVVSYEPTLLNYAIYNFIKDSVYPDVSVAQKYVKKSNYNDVDALLRDVSNGNIDALVVRDKEGKKLTSSGDKFKLIKGDVSGPDLIVFYNPKNSSIDSNKIKGVFLSMTEDNSSAKEALVAAKEFTPGENKQFRELTKQDIEFLKSLSSIDTK